MSLLSWVKEKPPAEDRYEIPIKYTRYGRVVVIAPDGGMAVDIWDQMTTDEVEAVAEWHEDEYDIGWCGGINKVEE